MLDVGVAHEDVPVTAELATHHPEFVPPLVSLLHQVLPRSWGPNCHFAHVHGPDAVAPARGEADFVPSA